MPPCKEVKAAKYQTRKSPSFHAQDCKDMTKKGKDGNYISKPDVRGVYKWVKAGSQTRKKCNTTTYTILDNGNHPFQVEVNGKTVEICKGTHDPDDYDIVNYNVSVKKLPVQDVYPGEALCDPAIMVGRDFMCGKEYLGNTVLLHVSGNRYIYVGATIYEFTMEDDFEAYYSVIGPNDVPCPVLLGSKNVYLLGSNICSYIPREMFKGPMSPAEWADGEAYYFGLKDLKTGEKKTNIRTVSKKFVTKIKGIKLIHKRT